ncbi:hypothetical protein LAC81_37490 (plasmid) [Ensifer adhaerens]|uniref:hypothetical protein n=1 Tax=Ensifer adhaerens TaxID=106592 RepID=UPI001CBB97CD|nr:hypothetical protein [Ensifer adhaerens]MBZ7927635.1 hypothetical protein [Ensifer adhaerens]UAX98033.1 hypothetical protein LAC78_38790 [Ensifer adhaerens]UAY05414.1 hypothetical protein LAC80_37505 [Ensifer adhaerens]UAY12792.1 hypothetical protein LAC81_37490 [Ensifer adhaerens]
MEIRIVVVSSLIALEIKRYGTEPQTAKNDPSPRTYPFSAAEALMAENLLGLEQPMPLLV